VPKLAHNTVIVPQLPGIGKCDIYKLTIARQAIRIGLPYQGVIPHDASSGPALAAGAPSVFVLLMLVAFSAGCPRRKPHCPTHSSTRGLRRWPSPANTLPATGICYVGQAARGAEFSIGGQRALGQKADCSGKGRLRFAYT